ncbi:phage tail protein [Ectopseudomonas oleovorans]|uniref:Tail-collar fiber protein n=1 Tax=Ectopseudomonas oleovorans TaxID=301 RepID=A0A3D9EDX5_ECTOL|nr:phage tail protein [Pseudomonas oleovorans]RED01278.1 tail-collar fiber protein [Pseudomonas oleovorans]
MSQTYYAILTAIGEAKLANAAALNTTLKIAKMAVGDGGGVVPTPNRTQTALAGEWYRAGLNTLAVDPSNTSQIIAELVIPEATGGNWIREMGLIDADGNLIAVANTPPSYKPQLAEGSGRTQVLRMVLIVSSASAVELKIDPSVVLATRQYVDDAITVAVNRLDNKQSVRVATTANLTLTGTPTVDGVALAVGDRILVKNQDTAGQNGLYLVAAGAWNRALDADASSEVTPGLTVYVEQGTVQADTIWKLVTDAPMTLGNTALTFADITSGYAPLRSPVFTDSPTAPTTDRFDNSKRLATTEFAKLRGLELSTVKVVTAAGTTLAAADVGKAIRISLPASSSIVLPATADVPQGATLLLKNVSAAAVVALTPAGADVLSRAVKLLPLTSLLLVAVPAEGLWAVSAGSAEAVEALAAGVAGQWAFRNKLINGNFDLWQRGINFAGAGYCADRWRVESLTSITVGRGFASAPYGKFYLLITPTAAANQLSIAQALEDFLAVPFAGKRATFSFQANSGVAQTITAYIQKSAIANQATVAGGWTTIASKVCAIGPGAQAFSITADVPNDGTANGLRVAFAVTNAANGVGIGIWGCQLEDGPLATPFEFRHLALEAVLCQSYFEVGNCAYESYGANPNYGSYWHPWTVRKRAAPTITLINASSGANSGAPAVAASNAAGFRPRALCSTTGQQVWTCDYIADAELN